MFRVRIEQECSTDDSFRFLAISGMGLSQCCKVFPNFQSFDNPCSCNINEQTIGSSIARGNRGFSEIGRGLMPGRKEYFRKVFWIEVALLLILAIPIVVWASGMSKVASGSGFVTTDPVALTLLGSTLIFLGFVIRRLKS